MLDVEPDAEFECVVLEPDGKEYFVHKLSATNLEPRRASAGSLAGRGILFHNASSYTDAG